MPSATRRTYQRLGLFIAAAGCAGLAAAYVIPLRLLLGPLGSYFTFGYVGDEYLYAARVQPLLPGTTALNHLNGICYAGISSPFVLEDMLRVVIQASGLNTITCIWVWKFLMPVVLAVCLALLVRACLPRSTRPWLLVLRWALAAALLPALLSLYDVLTPFPPLQGFINRFPTNIEYPLSIVLASLFVMFARKPTMSAGILLAGVGAATVYLRPYLALPWGLALSAGLGWMLAAGRVRARIVLAMSGAGIVALAPWLVAAVRNKLNPDFAEYYARYMYLPRPYELHSRWGFLVLTALLLFAAGWRAPRWSRPVVWGGAFTLAALPFISGLLSISAEIVPYDRFGPFYQILILAAAALILRAHIETWRGAQGRMRALRVARMLAIAALGLSAILALRNAEYDFAEYPAGPYRSIVADLQYVPAYQWIDRNTAADALFLVDEGFDYTRAPTDPVEINLLHRTFPASDDLFQLVGRRRRVFKVRIEKYPLPPAALRAVTLLHRGTFGLPVKEQDYDAALRRIKPAYILWRKVPILPFVALVPPVPRGLGARLAHDDPSYEDDACVIWKLRYTGGSE